MSEKQHIMIKGVKEGLLFLLDDQCSFDVLVQELQHKIEKTHHQLLTGPLIHIHIRLGQRELKDEQTKQLTDIIRTQGNLIIKSIETDLPLKNKAHCQMKVLTTIVRSGQVIEAEEDLLLIGDVHPGGMVRCGGDLYVLGSLKGHVYAGLAGRDEAIVVASYLQPSLIVIGEHHYQPSDEISSDGHMEVASVADGYIQIEKLSVLHHKNRLPVYMKGV